tara:strand:- start:2226 stop:2672 length:447 start_codon:yes stop_codon:yes gene_type:complete
MIDTDKYEGHSTGWKHKINHSTYGIINDDGHKVASIGACEDWQKDKSHIDSQLIADAPLLLQALIDERAEVKRLREGIEQLEEQTWQANEEVERLREALITVQRSLIWSVDARSMDGDPITLEALVAQVEQVQSDITYVWLRGETYEF